MKKCISKIEKLSFESRTSQFQQIFGPCSNYVFLPIGISDSINILESQKTPQKSKCNNCYWLKMETFSKDLEDELNLKILKNKPFSEPEIWDLLFSLIFVLDESFADFNVE